MRADDLLAIRRHDRDTGTAALDALDADRWLQRDAFLGELGNEKTGELLILVRQERPGIDGRYGGAEPVIGLGQLDPDRPAADNDQMSGSLAVRENCLVREIPRRVEAGDRRHDRVRACRDDKPARTDQRVAGLRSAAIEKTRFGADDSHPKPLETFLRVVRGDRGDDPFDTVRHRSKVDTRRFIEDAERTAMPSHIGEFRRGEQRFRGHTAVIEAVAAHLAAL